MIESCHFEGVVKCEDGKEGAKYLGGIVGWTDLGRTIKNCTVNGSVIDTGTSTCTYIGGVAGYAYHGVSGNKNYYLEGSATYSSPTSETVGKSSRDFFQSYSDNGLIAKMESENAWGSGTWGLDPVKKLPIPVECGGKDAYLVMNISSITPTSYSPR